MGIVNVDEIMWRRRYCLLWRVMVILFLLMLLLHLQSVLWIGGCYWDVFVVTVVPVVQVFSHSGDCFAYNAVGALLYVLLSTCQLSSA